MEKLELEKYMGYTSELNFIAGQITRDGTLLLIESDLDELDFFERPVPKRNWSIKIIQGGRIETVELKDVPLIPTEVDLFSDGTLLIVQGRCLKEGEYIEKNARRYDRSGRLIDAFTLGDGIQQVQIDETDTIWVSYFDEGIFGNFGWDNPMGSDGVVQYTSSGEKVWGARDFGIVDCYALNVVSSKEIYFYYYDDFHLVKLNENEESTRYRVNCRHHTIEQFMLDGADILAEVDVNSVMRYRKKFRSYTPKGNLEVVDEKGNHISGTVFMRGEYLYVLSKDGIYKKK